MQNVLLVKASFWRRMKTIIFPIKFIIVENVILFYLLPKLTKTPAHSFLFCHTTKYYLLLCFYFTRLEGKKYGFQLALLPNCFFSPHQHYFCGLAWPLGKCKLEKSHNIHFDSKLEQWMFQKNPVCGRLTAGMSNNTKIVLSSLEAVEFEVQFFNASLVTSRCLLLVDFY